MFLKSCLLPVLFLCAITEASAQRRKDPPAPVAQQSEALTIPESGEGFIFFTTIAGQTVKWRVDTGADNVVLNRTTADLLGIKVPSDKYVNEDHVVGEVILFAQAKIPVFDLGPLRGRDVIADLLVHDPKLDIGNLLGMTFLRQFRWYYEKGQLTLW